MRPGLCFMGACSDTRSATPPDALRRRRMDARRACRNHNWTGVSRRPLVNRARRAVCSAAIRDTNRRSAPTVGAVGVEGLPGFRLLGSPDFALRAPRYGHGPPPVVGVTDRGLHAVPVRVRGLGRLMLRPTVERGVVCDAGVHETSRSGDRSLDDVTGRQARSARGGCSRAGQDDMPAPEVRSSMTGDRQVDLLAREMRN